MEIREQYDEFITATVRDALLQRLLLGRAREVEGLPELLREFGLAFASDRFAVLGLRLCDAYREEGQWSPPPEPDIHGLATRFLHDTVGWDAWELLQDDVYFSVLCRNGTDGVSPSRLGQALVERLKPVHAVAVAISLEKTGMGGLNDAYYEVLEVLGIIDMQELRNKALSYEQLDATTYQNMDTTFERDRRLINCVLEGNREETLIALNQRIASGALDSRNTLMLEKRRLLGLVNQMTAEITADGDSGFLAELDAFKKLMDAPAAEQLNATFQSVVLGLCDYFSCAQEDMGINRAIRIADYVDRHFADPELSIDVLSGIFKISPSYLSRIFKREKGTGVLPYLQSKRIAKARYLLSTTNMKVREIALQVGYLNEQTFARTFKNVTGETPSSYREKRP